MAKASRFAVAVYIIILGLMAPAGITYADSLNTTSKYVVYARNESENLVAQVFLRGNPPRVVTSGLFVEYNILENTYSSVKKRYGRFFTSVRRLFGEIMPVDKVLDLVEPKARDGLNGRMVVKDTYFEAVGMPLAPADGMGIWNPYRVAVITVKNNKGTVLAETRAAIPTSDEINCGKCHGVDHLKDVLQRHDRLHGTTLASQEPVLCSDCHSAPGSI